MPSARKPDRRDAAAVLLIRGEGADLEVFLVERSPQLRFFGGYLALPGGVRGPEDGPNDPNGSDTTALRKCGERELFEETGVLIDPVLRARWDAGDRDEARRELLAGDETPGARWDAARGASAPTPALLPLCRVCTPPFAPVRYDTLFLLGHLPDGEVPDVWEGELTGGRFWRPDDVLAAWRRDEIAVVPPVLILLERLHDGDLDAFRQRAAAQADAYERGEIHRVRFSPGVILASVRTPTLPPATTTNCLIVGEDRLFVIDPATPFPEEQQRLFDLLDSLVAEGRELAGVLVTHHHPDHVGAVHATSERYGLEVRGHPLTLERLAPGFREGAPLEDRDRIPLGTAPDGRDGWELVAMFTPGHDRGHLCFRETRYDAVAVGDMLSTVSTIVIDPPEGHLRTYLDSLERLLEEPMGTLYPAHGPAVKDGHRLVQHYLRHRAQREAALVKALGDLGSSGALPGELVPAVYWEIDEVMYPLAERSLVAGLDKLVEDGVARREGEWFVRVAE